MKTIVNIVGKIKPFILPVVLILMGLALWGMREKIITVLAGAQWHLVFCAFGIALVYLPLNASVWGVILQTFGVNVTRRQAATTWLRCEALRWLPGSIWGYASRTVEARKFGCSKLVAGLSLMVELAVTVAAWAILAFIGLGLSGFIFELLAKVSPGVKQTILIGLGLSILCIVVAPVAYRFAPQKIKSSVRNRLLSITSEIKHPYRLIQALFEYVVLNFLYSIGFYLCFQALIQSEASPGFLASVGANAMGWLAGLVSVGVPSGIGVREGVIAMVFQPFNLVAEAGAGAFLWRGVQLIVEMSILVALVSFQLAFKRRKQSTQHQPPVKASEKDDSEESVVLSDQHVDSALSN